LGDKEWFNTWGLEGPDTPDTDAFALLAGQLVTFHRGILFSYYKVDRVVISTAEQDSKPYNPATFFTFPVAQPGLETPSGTVLPLTNVIDVRKVAPSGRNGHLFLRGGLSTDNVDSPGGVPQLSDPSALETAFVTAYGAMSTAVSATWTFGIITKTGSSMSFRPVSTLSGPVLTSSSAHRPRKAFVSPADPVAQMAKIFEDAKTPATIVNTVIDLFNLIPALPDVPLLPG
jgi:hypothetical protein